MRDDEPVTDHFEAESTASDLPSTAGYGGDPAVQSEWDSRYADREQMWSGQPNGALVAEVAGLMPGRVLTSAAARARTPSGSRARAGT